VEADLKREFKVAMKKMKKQVKKLKRRLLEMEKKEVALQQVGRKCE
jgi:hypothetical protein